MKPNSIFLYYSTSHINKVLIRSFLDTSAPSFPKGHDGFISKHKGKGKESLLPRCLSHATLASHLQPNKTRVERSSKRNTTSTDSGFLPDTIAITRATRASATASCDTMGKNIRPSQKKSKTRCSSRFVSFGKSSIVVH